MRRNLIWICMLVCLASSVFAIDAEILSPAEGDVFTMSENINLTANISDGAIGYYWDLDTVGGIVNGEIFGADHNKIPSLLWQKDPLLLSGEYNITLIVIDEFGGFALDSVLITIESSQGCKNILGDINYDGIIDFNDYDLAKDSSYNPCIDMDQDGQFDFEDLEALTVKCGPDCDADKDLVVNNEDNCPNTINPGQQDIDNDGSGDACDTCTDTDGDGYGNPNFIVTGCVSETLFDNCPGIPNEDQVDTDSDYTGDICDDDIDGDDVLNEQDKNPVRDCRYEGRNDCGQYLVFDETTGCCVSSCTNECGEGEKACPSTNIRAYCSGTMADGCRDWGYSECPGLQECSDGNCECVHQCNVGEKGCSGDGATWECKVSDENCRYKEETYCGDSEICLDAECKYVPVSNKLNMAVIILKNAETCVVGYEGSDCSLGGKDFSKNQLKGARPDDTENDNYPVSWCTEKVFSSEDVELIKNETNKFVDNVKQLTTGSLIIKPRFQQVSGKISLTHDNDCGLYPIPDDVSLLIRSNVKYDDHFVLVLHAYDTEDGYTIDSGSDGSTVGPEDGIKGAGYSEIVLDQEAKNNLAEFELRQFLYQLDYALEDVSYVEDIYGDTIYPPCKQGDSELTKWFPNPDDCTCDPDYFRCNDVVPACSYTCNQPSQFYGHVLQAHYPREASVVGNHCMNKKQDFDETGLDCGDKCPSC